MRKEFLQYNSRKQFSLISGFRGPDYAIGDDTLTMKYLITGRIRAIVATHEEVRGRMIYNPNPLTEEELNTVESISRKWNPLRDNQHYISHLEEAVDASRDHPIWGGLGTKLANALRGY